jgi:hypothetical protein
LVSPSLFLIAIIDDDAFLRRPPEPTRGSLVAE